jgi:hypothetical protein
VESTVGRLIREMLTILCNLSAKLVQKAGKASLKMIILPMAREKNRFFLGFYQTIPYICHVNSR